MLINGYVIVNKIARLLGITPREFDAKYRRLVPADAERFIAGETRLHTASVLMAIEKAGQSR